MMGLERLRVQPHFLFPLTILGVKAMAIHNPYEINNLGMVPMVIEQSGRGERSYDIYSRLLKERVIF